MKKNINKTKQTFLIDIDNTICITIGSDYLRSKPILRKIKVINDLYDQGHTIKYFTSRFMGRSNENISKAKLRGYNLTVRQLKKWGCKFHKVIMGKPSHDISIDDKSLFFLKNWDKMIKRKFL